jgi:hypothetical protein
MGCWKRIQSDISAISRRHRQDLRRAHTTMARLAEGVSALWNNHDGQLFEYSILRQRRPDTHSNPAARRVEERCVFTIGSLL